MLKYTERFCLTASRCYTEPEWEPPVLSIMNVGTYHCPLSHCKFIPNSLDEHVVRSQKIYRATVTVSFDLEMNGGRLLTDV